MESYRLAELKYAFFRRTGRKTKKLPRSKLFLWTVLEAFRKWWWGEEKLHFTPVHTLRQLKRDEALIPPFRKVIVSSGGTVRKLHAGLGCGPNLKSVGLTVEEK